MVRLAWLILLLGLVGCLRPNPYADLLDSQPDEGRPQDRGTGDRALASDRGQPVDTPRCGVGCPGCCLSDGSCVTVPSDTQCGRPGAPCADCTLYGQSCTQGVCNLCVAGCSGKPCGAPDGCGKSCEPGSGCLGCVWGSAGENGDPCPGVPKETWRCVFSAKNNKTVSQVCRQGAWQNYHFSPKGCADCCGEHTADCD